MVHGNKVARRRPSTKALLQRLFVCSHESPLRNALLALKVESPHECCAVKRIFCEVPSAVCVWGMWPPFFHSLTGSKTPPNHLRPKRLSWTCAQILVAQSRLTHTDNLVSKTGLSSSSRQNPQLVLLCFIKPVLGTQERFTEILFIQIDLFVNSITHEQAKDKYPRLRIADVQRFIHSVFTKDALDEKGQTRDTRVHVTLLAL